MYTSATVIALASLLTLPGTEGPSWQTDYGTALKQAQKAGKPLAVVFGIGKAGYDKVAREGLNAATRRVLSDEYVCCYVDVSTKGGQQLAAGFEISKDIGIVISDRAGKKQAFHYSGDLTVADLRRCLERFADPNVVVTTTVTDPNERTSAYPPSSVTNSGYNALGGAGMGYYGGSPFGQASGYCPSCSGGGGGFRRR